MSALPSPSFALQLSSPFRLSAFPARARSSAPSICVAPLPPLSTPPARLQSSFLPLPPVSASLPLAPAFFSSATSVSPPTPLLQPLLHSPLRGPHCSMSPSAALSLSPSLSQSLHLNLPGVVPSSLSSNHAALAVLFPSLSAPQSPPPSPAHVSLFPAPPYLPGFFCGLFEGAAAAPTFLRSAGLAISTAVTAPLRSFDSNPPSGPPLPCESRPSPLPSSHALPLFLFSPKPALPPLPLPALSLPTSHEAFPPPPAATAPLAAFSPSSSPAPTHALPAPVLPHAAPPSGGSSFSAFPLTSPSSALAIAPAATPVPPPVILSLSSFPGAPTAAETSLPSHSPPQA